MSEASLVGRVLGDFRLIRWIGQGGMGAVYEAEQISLGRRVALKVLAFGAAGDGSQGDRFRREAEAAARLNHPSIVAIYAQGREADIGFLAMELVEGQSLDRLLARLRSGPAAAPSIPVDPLAQTEKMEPGSLSSAPSLPSRSAAEAATGLPDRAWLHRAARYAAEAARALAYAHSLGVLHRDIKPANLILSSSGHIKITDFGLAGLRDAPGLTVSGEIMGTPAYMSPEQARGAARSVDERTDVYSLGATLYEMTTLGLPFSGHTPFDIIQRIVSETPPAARKINPRIPKDLDTIIAKMIEKEPAQRYPSAAEAAEDLERFLRGEPIKARPVGPVGRFVRLARRRKAAAALAAAGLIVLALFAGLARTRRQWSQAQRGLEQRETAATAAELVSNANQAIVLGRQDEALEALNEALGLAPNNAEALNVRARLSFSMDEYGQAIEDLDRLLAVEPRNAPALYLRSAAHRMRNEEQEADADEQSAQAINPDTPEAYFALAAAQRTAGDIEKAIANLDKAFRLNPSYFDALAARGQLFMRTEQWGKAEADFLRAASLAPGNPAPYPPLADILWRKGRQQEALETLREAQERLGRDDPNLLEALGQLRRREGQWAESIQALEKAIQLEPRNSKLHQSLAATKFMAGDCAGAAQALREPIKAQPASRLLSAQLMLTLSRMGRDPQAARAEAYETVVALSRESAAGRAARGGGLFASARGGGGRGPSSGKSPAGRPASRDARPRGGVERPGMGPAPLANPMPDNPIVLCQIALNFGDWDKALALADEATSRALGLVRAGRLAKGLQNNALLARIQALRSLGRFDEAAEAIQALESNPDLRVRGGSERSLLNQARSALQTLQRAADSARPKRPSESRAGVGQLIFERLIGGGALTRLGALGEQGRRLTPERMLEILDQPPDPARLQVASKMADEARKLTDQDPESAQGWLRLGLAQLVQGDEPQAQRSLERAMSLDPLLDEPYRCRALLRLNAGDDDGALDDLLRAWTAAPEKIEGLAYLLGLLYDAGRIAEADRIYDQAAFENADSVVLHRILAEWCARQVIHPERCEFYFSQLSLDLGRPQGASQFYEALRRSAQAAGHWALAARALPQGPSVSPPLAALIWELAGERDRARSIYTELASGADLEAGQRGLERLSLAGAARADSQPTSPTARSEVAAGPSGAPLSIPPRKAISIDGRPAAGRPIGPGRHAVEFDLKEGKSRLEIHIPADPPKRPAPVAILIAEPEAPASGEGAPAAAPSQTEALFEGLARFGFAVIRIETAAPAEAGGAAASSIGKAVAEAATTARRMLALLGEFGPKGPGQIDAANVSIVGLGPLGVWSASVLAAEEPRALGAAFVISDAEAEALLAGKSGNAFAGALSKWLRSSSGKRLLFLGCGQSPLALEACVEAARSAPEASVQIAFDQFDDEERYKRRARLLSLWLSAQAP